MRPVCLPMPSGGLITLNKTNSNESEIKLKSLRWCGISNRKDAYYDVDEIGWNYYMNEFSAAIGLEQLKKLESMNKRRKDIAKMYYRGIELDEKMPISNNSSYHLYWIRTKKRTKFIKFMNEHKIEVGVHYRPVHLMSAYSSAVSLPVTESIWPEIVSIPMHVNLIDSQVKFIIEKINEFKNKTG